MLMLRKWTPVPHWKLSNGFLFSQRASSDTVVLFTNMVSHILPNCSSLAGIFEDFQRFFCDESLAFNHKLLVKTVTFLLLQPLKSLSR